MRSTAGPSCSRGTGSPSWNGAPRSGLAEADIPVRQVRDWLGDLGLDTRVANLVIATYAELGRRAWVRAGRVVEPPASVDEVRDDMLLRRQRLPGTRGVDDGGRAGRGAVRGEAGLAGHLTPVGGEVRPDTARAEHLRAPAADLLAVLETSLPRLGVSTTVPPRLRTAETAVRLLDALRRAAGRPSWSRPWASATIEMPLITLSKSMSSAAQVADAVRNADWQVLDQLPTLEGPGRRGVRDTLRPARRRTRTRRPAQGPSRDARRRSWMIVVARRSARPSHPPRRIRSAQDPVVLPAAVRRRDAPGAGRCSSGRLRSARSSRPTPCRSPPCGSWAMATAEIASAAQRAVVNGSARIRPARVRRHRDRHPQPGRPGGGSRRSEVDRRAVRVVACPSVLSVLDALASPRPGTVWCCSPTGSEERARRRRSRSPPSRPAARGGPLYLARDVSGRPAARSAHPGRVAGWSTLWSSSPGARLLPSTAGATLSRQRVLALVATARLGRDPEQSDLPGLVRLSMTQGSGRVALLARTDERAGLTEHLVSVGTERPR